MIQDVCENSSAKGGNRLASKHVSSSCDGGSGIKLLCIFRRNLRTKDAKQSAYIKPCHRGNYVEPQTRSYRCNTTLPYFIWHSSPAFCRVLERGFLNLVADPDYACSPNISDQERLVLKCETHTRTARSAGHLGDFT